MRSINKVILIGNLTRDPEMRQTPNGQSVVTFGLATNREWVTKDGRKQNSAEFHDLVAWAKLADICHTYLKKGKLVYVEGYLKTRSWDTPEGIKKFRTEIVVQDMIMLDKRSGEESGDYVPEDSMDVAETPAPAKEESNEEDKESTLEPATEENPAPATTPAEVAVKEDEKEELKEEIAETKEEIKEEPKEERIEPKEEPKDEDKKKEEKPQAAEPAAQPATQSLDIDSDLGL